jgi:hypothetical protein
VDVSVAKPIIEFLDDIGGAEEYDCGVFCPVFLVFCSMFPINFKNPVINEKGSRYAGYGMFRPRRTAVKREFILCAQE